MAPKKQKKTYKRNQFIHIGFREPFNGFEYDGEGKITKVLLDGGKTAAPDAVFSSIEYVRASGKRKVVSSVPDIASLDEFDLLRRNFDVIAVVDTNTLRANGEIFSVACYAAGLTKHFSIEETSAGRLVAKPNMKSEGFIFFKNCDHPGTAEKFSLWQVVSMLMKSANFNKLRYGIITDHDLNKHTQWNAGEIPIFGVFKLPSNVKLLFASADVGSSTFLAALISLSDKEASRVLRELQDKGATDIEGTVVSLADIPDYAEISKMP